MSKPKGCRVHRFKKTFFVPLASFDGVMVHLKCFKDCDVGFQSKIYKANFVVFHFMFVYILTRSTMQTHGAMQLKLEMEKNCCLKKWIYNFKHSIAQTHLTSFADIKLFSNWNLQSQFVSELLLGLMNLKSFSLFLFVLSLKPCVDVSE